MRNIIYFAKESDLKQCEKKQYFAREQKLQINLLTCLYFKGNEQQRTMCQSPRICKFWSWAHGLHKDWCRGEDVLSLQQQKRDILVVTSRTLITLFEITFQIHNGSGSYETRQEYHPLHEIRDTHFRSWIDTMTCQCFMRNNWINILEQQVFPQLIKEACQFN